MKRLLLVCLFLFSGAIFSQELIINDFDEAPDSNYWAFYQNDNADTNISFMNFEFVTDPVKDGAAAMLVDYSVHNAETWGGFVKLEHWNPDSNGTYDWTLYDSLSVWYYNAAPQSDTGTVSFRLNLHDVSDATTGNKTYDVGQVEYWYSFHFIMDSEPGWNQIKLSLTGDTEADQSGDGMFHITNWSGIQGNQILDLDKIKGFSFELSIGGTGEGNNSAGQIVFDKMALYSPSAKPLVFFNGGAIPSTMEQFSWGGSAAVEEGAGSSETSPNAIKWNIGDAWSGTGFNILDPANMTFSWPADTLKFKMKSDAVGNLRIQFEDGAAKIGTNFDPVADGAWHSYEFALADLTTYYDGTANFDITNVAVLQILTEGTGVSGQTVYIDDWWTGNPEFDVVPPEAPGLVLVAAGDYVNLITWTDVVGEADEVYDVYYSLTPITDLSAAGIEVVALGVAENEQVATHTLRAPLIDQDVDFYYAVVCKDAAGNVGEMALSDPASITNKAQGVAVINYGAPVDFVADGNFSEWAGIQPFRMFPSDGSGTIVTNQEIDGDADCSLLAYLAADAEYLYFAFDFTDDINSVDTNIATYLTDGLDLFIGLYNWHGPSHTGHQRGLEPDYQFRFLSNQVISGNTGDQTLLTPGDDYSWKEKFPSGYTYEGKLSFEAISQAANPDDVLYTPDLGHRIKIDFSINDADATGQREGILTYSPNNQDQSWADVSRWLYTWMGDSMVSDVNENDNVQNTFELSQNYPNPFNPSTTINYSVPTNGLVTLKVFNVLGQEVKTLVNKVQNAGGHTVSYDASQLASGVYIYRLSSGNFIGTKKMLLVK